MSGQMKHWRVWSGFCWEETFAVSEAKAISNVAWRMRQQGLTVVRWRMEAEEVK